MVGQDLPSVLGNADNFCQHWITGEEPEVVGANVNLPIRAPNGGAHM